MLAAHDVEYMIVGGIAVGAHGHVRYTKDMDVWFRGTEKNADVVASVIALDDLKRNKRAVGRLQDLADIENLDETSGRNVNAED